MKAQTSAYLVKSQEALDDANKSFEVGMAGQAARLAYLAAFHAAQALIMEMTSKAAKTHKGVHARFAELARLTKSKDLTPAFSAQLITSRKPSTTRRATFGS